MTPLLRGILCLVVTLGFLPLAAAQTLDEGTGEVSIRLRSEAGDRGGSLGVGGQVRAGDWAGMLLRINDSNDKQRDVLIRLTIPDADGDRVHYERVLTTNPGVPQPLWMYVRIPYRYKAGDQILVSAFAALEREGDIPAPGGERRWTYAPGRLLGATRILLSPSDMVPKTEGMIAVLGQRQMGMGRYQGDPQETYMRGGHERTRLITGLRPEDLPDRWMGLMPFEIIVWADGQPGALGTERAQALREWVMRGGHLVIVLPQVGQMWTDSVNNPLFEIVPRVRPERREAVDLSEYSVLISRDKDAKLPTNQILHVLHPLPDAGPTEAMCILAGPAPAQGDGSAGTPECLVARRLVGTGMVTMVGLNIASGALASGQRDWPELELFWHRVLGKRGEHHRLTASERNTRGWEARGEFTLDRDVSNEIAKTGLASGGVLIGFVVFVAYWLVAGPLGYALLTKTGNKRHAWVVFVLATGVFTAIAWGGARAIRPGSVETSHLTILEHVFGQDVDRARSWVSLLIPEYGEAAIALGNPAMPDVRFTNAIAPWDGDDSAGDGFPDSRSYRIESKNPDLVVIPTRSTVKQFQLDWAGGPPWKMPYPLPTSSGEDGEIELYEKDGRPAIRGVLAHQLPGVLREVTIIVNFGQKDLARSFAGVGAMNMTSDAVMVSLPGGGEWKPDEPLDLSGLELSQDKLNAFKDLLDKAGRVDSDMGDADRARVGKRLTALSLFSQLQPPNARPSASDFRGEAFKSAQRRLTHGWDMGEWFTQPCVIIIGQLGSEEGEESPVPLYVSFGGEYRAVPQVGRTLVRWVYPLAADPPAYPAPSEDETFENEEDPV